jgi:signal transduction histidine kinase
MGDDRYARGRHPRYIFAFRDTTTHNRLVEGIPHLDRNAAVAHVSAGVAHNFNNIFGGIVLNAELMVGADAADQRLFAERITTGAGRGADLCRKLLTVARGEAPALRAIPVGPVVADLLALFETEANRFGVSIHCTVTGYPAVQGDPNQLRQILLNLLFNAREAIGRNGSIFLEVRPVGDLVSIAISNSGPAIPEEHLPLIFMPFFSTKTDHVQGTGLGLAICQSLAAGMSGDI